VARPSWSCNPDREPRRPATDLRGTDDVRVNRSGMAELPIRRDVRPRCRRARKASTARSKLSSEAKDRACGTRTHPSAVSTDPGARRPIEASANAGNVIRRSTGASGWRVMGVRT
jgi:hypothetical protein